MKVKNLSFPYSIDEIAHILTHVSEVLAEDAAVIARDALNLPKALVGEEAQLFLFVFTILRFLG